MRLICFCQNVFVAICSLHMEAVQQGMEVSPSSRWPVSGDRIGVVASILCAIHCAATPIVLLVLPAFGKVWAHPASHWLMASLVIPLAAFMVMAGFRKHRRKWGIVSGVLGSVFILMGAAAPSCGKASEPGAADVEGMVAPGESFDCAVGDGADPSCASEGEESVCESDSECAGSECTDTASGEPAEECVDACCPSIQADADGGWSIHVPLASILTTIGGFFLIVTHIGNLVRCSCSVCGPEEAMA